MNRLPVRTTVGTPPGPLKSMRTPSITGGPSGSEAGGAVVMIVATNGVTWPGVSWTLIVEVNVGPTSGTAMTFSFEVSTDTVRYGIVTAVDMTAAIPTGGMTPRKAMGILTVRLKRPLINVTFPNGVATA